MDRILRRQVSICFLLPTPSDKGVEEAATTSVFFTSAAFSLLLSEVLSGVVAEVIFSSKDFSLSS